VQDIIHVSLMENCSEAQLVLSFWDELVHNNSNENLHFIKLKVMG